MDLGLVEYALWASVGLWATLFVDNAIARAAGIVLIALAVLRALTEKDTTSGQDSRARAPQSVGSETSEPAEPAIVPAPTPRQRRRVL
jgi:hypothetical protein